MKKLLKIYGQNEEGKDVVIRTERQPVYGKPDLNLVSTSYVEWSNLSIRMGNRRFTRATNAFSKKLENHCHMLAVSFMHYNFSRRHSTLKTTPAVAAGVANHEWTMLEIVKMIDAHHEAILAAQFEKAFQTYQPRNFTPERTKPLTYAPVAPKLPWYLDPNGEDPTLEKCSLTENLSHFWTSNFQNRARNDNGRPAGGYHKEPFLSRFSLAKALPRWRLKSDQNGDPKACLPVAAWREARAARAPGTVQA